MSRFRFPKKLVSTIAISIAVGLVLSLSGSVSALRRIDNRVDINAPTISLGDSGVSSSSGNYAFEKGDAIYRPFDVSAFMELPLRPADKILLLLWSRVGHAGLYWYWEPDENSDPTIKENHKTIESNLARPHPLLKPLKGAGVHDNYDFQYFVDSGGCWGVRTSERLDDNIRRRIIAAATKQLGCRYHFFGGYKRPGVSFRCDGLVEYCYEIALGDEWKPGRNGGIVKNDFWRPRRGCRVLYPRRQFNYLTAEDNAFFPTLIFGKLEGVVMREPIWIEGVEIHPEDGRYEVYGDKVEVNIHASDIDWDSDGSGITRLELWVGEVDDTPGEMPGLRLDRKDYPNGPMEDDYAYTWDTTKKEDGEPLFPNGDYTLKAIGFDQAGNKAEAELAVEVANAGKYLYIHIEPSYVETDWSNNDRTGAFDVYVEVWNFGKCPEEGCLPEGCKPKKEGTQSWYYDGGEGKYKQEVCCTNFEVEPSQDTEISGMVVLSPLHPDVNPDSESSGLWKDGWDGTITITNGVGSVSNVRYRDKDGNNISGRRMVFLVKASMGGANGNDLLMINPIFLEPSTAGGNNYEGQFRGIRGSHEPRYATGHWGAQSCQPPYGDWGKGCVRDWLPLECGKSYYGGQGGKNTWCAMKLLWAARGWGEWGNLTEISVAHVYNRSSYLLCHLGGEYWPGGGNIHRALAAQKLRVPYHAINPDTGEILAGVTSAVALAKFGRTGGGMELRPMQMHYTPTVTCQTSGVARVIDEEGEDEALTYDFGDVSSLFDGSEYLKVEYHPDDSIIPNLFPYGDPPTWWGGWQWVEINLFFKGQYPQIMVIP